MNEILIITTYYPPETGAAANRIAQLANGLEKNGFKVTVITPLPNYPTGRIFKNYKGSFHKTSHEDHITIHRLWIYASNSKNKLLRLLAMLSYSFSLLWFFIWKKVPNKVIVQSPPLLVAFTCMFFLNRKKRKLILNVSDLWPLAGLHLGVFKKNFAYRILEFIEHFNYRKADLILGQSEEILAHISSLCPNNKTFLYRNYPDFEMPRLEESYQDNDKIKLVYAGLLGVAQGVFKLCQKLDYSTIEFHVYGAGHEKESIINYISNNPTLPIIYHGEVSRGYLHPELIKYDLAIIPLRNRIYGSVPSKLFEYSRLGLPVLYFGGGEGEKIVEKYSLGWIAKVGNYSNLNIVLSRINKADFTLKNKVSIQQVALNQFDFNRQLKKFIKQL
ncbi:glycosyltransferase involved in cell wall biosynthesis [Flavobacteriaceae bacterium MAR_2010_72]|nr:glycosyltransferase involved in cell wall biosynthesis [Flavobacteriaceae bacterium MAR_2010_72]TVZ58256.1 glycosyltransferase involved in cell wall biosynthesis [Flavobacteriaceae bacterium MAR_2010_105]